MNCYSRLLCKDTKEVKKTMKYRILTFTALAGGVVAELFGGWDRALQTLLLFMAMDWITGGILLPGVFGKSPKSPTGALESRAGWKGLCRKGMTLLYVLIAAQLDRLLGVNYVRDAVCIGFIANCGKTWRIYDNHIPDRERNHQNRCTVTDEYGRSASDKGNYDFGDRRR